MADNYIARFQPEWQELESLVGRARKSIRNLSPAELSRLDVLYRRTCSHLAQVSTRTTDQGLIRYLNDLTAAAHTIIYLPPRARLLKQFPTFLTTTFPASVARMWRFHMVAVGLLVLGSITAFLTVLQDATNAYALLIGDELRHPGASKDQLLYILRNGRDSQPGEKFHFASFLFSHNLKVGLLALATGIVAAIPTVFLTLYNGLMVGAFAAVHHNAGIDAEFWAWILPHGITELLAIALCSGAGLRIGHSVVSPGLLTRSESLRLAGEEAARTIVGVAIMLLIAAVIESYLRQSHLSQFARFTFAGISFCFWAAYFATGFIVRRPTLDS